MTEPAALPTITIERTPANDVYLVLAGLGIGPDVERVLTDPLSFLRSHRGEIRLVAGWVEGRLAAATAGQSPSTAATDAEPAPAAPARARRGRRSPVEQLRRTPSLLR